MRTEDEILAEIDRRATYLEALEADDHDDRHHRTILIEYAVLRSLLWSVLSDAEVRDGTSDRLLFGAIERATERRLAREAGR